MVFDSSTLILLAKIDLLREVAGEIAVVIPELVKVECLAKDGPDAKLVSVLIEEKKIVVEKVDSPSAVKKIVQDFRIDAGEAEALWLARKIGCPLAVDDGPTIKTCKILGQGFTTAIHFLLHLAASGSLDRELARAKLEKLTMYGRYSRRIIDDAAMRLKGGKP